MQILQRCWQILIRLLILSPWLFLVPVMVIGLIIKKTPPLIALLAGTLLAAIFALFFQPQIIMNIAGATELTFNSAYKGLMTAITVDTAIATDNRNFSKVVYGWRYGKNDGNDMAYFMCYGFWRNYGCHWSFG